MWGTTPNKGLERGLRREGGSGDRGHRTGIIVEHTNRRLGKLEPCDACERLISGRISFSEFASTIGECCRELLDFMMEHDLHRDVQRRCSSA